MIQKMRPEMPDEALTGPGYGTLSVAAILAETARRSPDRNALLIGDQAITYGPLWEQTRAYAGALAERGVGPGSRVAVLIPNVPDFARVYYAVLALGAVVVPVHLLFKAEEIEYVLRDSGASLLVLSAHALADGTAAAAAAQVPVVTVLQPEGPSGRLEDEARASRPIRNYVSVNPLAPATILYTSGTTGRPKGAVSSHLALIEQVHVSLIDSARCGRTT